MVITVIIIKLLLIKVYTSFHKLYLFHVFAQKGFFRNVLQNIFL